MVLMDQKEMIRLILGGIFSFYLLLLAGGCFMAAYCCFRADAKIDYFGWFLFVGVVLVAAATMLIVSILKLDE